MTSRSHSSWFGCYRNCILAISLVITQAKYTNFLTEDWLDTNYFLFADFPARTSAYDSICIH